MSGFNCSDRLTPDQRTGTQDCLCELMLAWLQRPFAAMDQRARGEAILEACLLISQMRHRDPKQMEIERRRWVDRVTARLCAQIAEMKGYEGSVYLELEHRVTAAMLVYHDWREQHAPKFTDRSNA